MFKFTLFCVSALRECIIEAHTNRRLPKTASTLTVSSDDLDERDMASESGLLLLFKASMNRVLNLTPSTPMEIQLHDSSLSLSPQSTLMVRQSNCAHFQGLHWHTDSRRWRARWSNASTVTTTLLLVGSNVRRYEAKLRRYTVTGASENEWCWLRLLMFLCPIPVPPSVRAGFAQEVYGGVSVRVWAQEGDCVWSGPLFAVTWRTRWGALCGAALHVWDWESCSFDPGIIYHHGHQNV